MGRALRHLLCVSSPCAKIFLGSPSSAWHSWFSLMRFTERLKCATLLSREDLSEEEVDDCSLQ